MPTLAYPFLAFRLTETELRARDTHTRQVRLPLDEEEYAGTAVEYREITVQEIVKTRFINFKTNFG